MVVPAPRGLAPLIVGRLVATWDARPFCAVACAAGLRFHHADSVTLSAMLVVAGYGAVVSEWFRPVVARPIVSVGPVGRARVAALR
eukprot:7887827-Alexandrium_andersonii.AAC.1